MKKLLLILLLCASALPALAGDLTAVAVNSVSGGSTGSVDLTVSGGVAPYTYSWSGPGGFSATTEDIAGLAAGTYTVTVTDYYCGIAMLSVVVDEDTVTSVTDPTLLSAFSAYPNPFLNEVHIQFNSTVQGDAYLQLTDAKGQVLASELIRLELKQNDRIFTLSQPLAAGVYFLRVMHENAVVAKAKLIHQ